MEEKSRFSNFGSNQDKLSEKKLYGSILLLLTRLVKESKNGGSWAASTFTKQVKVNIDTIWPFFKGNVVVHLFGEGYFCWA